MVKAAGHRAAYKHLFKKKKIIKLFNEQTTDNLRICNLCITASQFLELLKKNVIGEEDCFLTAILSRFGPAAELLKNFDKVDSTGVDDHIPNQKDTTNISPLNSISCNMSELKLLGKMT